MIAEIDQNGVETQYVYNQYGELTEVIEPSVTNPATGRVGESDVSLTATTSTVTKPR